MSKLTDADKTLIENETKELVENDILKHITDGSLPNDVFNKLDDPANKYYMDCAPVGHSAEEISTYNVPINSEYTRDSARLDIYKTLVNLCLVIIFMILTYFLVPHFYKYGIVDVINKMFEGDDQDKGKLKQRLERITTIDIILSVWMLGLILFFALLSFSVGMWGSYIFVLLIIIYILSMVIIDGKKKEDNFMTTNVLGGNVKTFYEIGEDGKIDYFKNVNILDFVSFITDFVKYLFGYDDIFNKKAVKSSDRMPKVFLIWVAIIIVIYFPIAIFILKNDYNGGFVYGTLPFYIMLPAILYFCLVFDVGTEYRRNHIGKQIGKVVTISSSENKDGGLTRLVSGALSAITGKKD